MGHRPAIPRTVPRQTREADGAATVDFGLVGGDGDGGVVLFAHGSGSSRLSPRNRYVAGDLNGAGLGTLLVDLLAPEEEEVDLRTRHLRFDVGLLATRLVALADWLGSNETTAGRPIGLFGASTGGGAALVAAADRPEAVATTSRSSPSTKERWPA